MKSASGANRNPPTPRARHDPQRRNLQEAQVPSAAPEREVTRMSMAAPLLGRMKFKLVVRMTNMILTLVAYRIVAFPI